MLLIKTRERSGEDCKMHVTGESDLHMVKTLPATGSTVKAQMEEKNQS